MNDDFENWLAGREREEPVDDGCMLRPGQRIGAYKIVRQLGVGGMGQVYEAEHVALGVRRALKVFSTESEHSEFLRKRFVAEGRILADLQHPRIVRVYDLVVDEDSDMAYFEMDLVLSPGGQPRTLADELQDGVDEEKIVGWFEDICEGLAYIHSQGVVHRDISLDNILIGRDGRAVITDFGIAKIIDDSYRKKIDVTVTMLYKDGSEVRIGKERYMAPELKKPNGRASFATDAWALGVLLFRMLSGSWYDVGTRLEDWHADLKYDWRKVLSRLFKLEPAKRLCDGGIAALPTLLNRKACPVVSWYREVVMMLYGIVNVIKCKIAEIGGPRSNAEGLKYDFVTDTITGRKSVRIVKARIVTDKYVIPESIGGYNVTSIGAEAFSDCDGLTGITIPGSVTSIGESAFEGCWDLASVLMLDGVTSIGERAFCGCRVLAEVQIPSSVSSIGAGAFSGCRIKNVMIPAGVLSVGENAFSDCNAFSVATANQNYKSVSGLLLTKDGTTLVCGVNGDVMIPDGVTSIGAKAFEGCGYLKSVTMPNSVTSIGSRAFSSCRRLKSIAIPSSVTCVGEGAFEFCWELENILVDVGNETYCSQQGLLLSKDGKSLVAVPIRREKVTIPHSVTNIESRAFFWCMLREVVVSPNVKIIGSESFLCCERLMQVLISDGVTNIEKRAFSSCRSLTSIMIPSSVISIGEGAFTGCANLEQFVIAKGGSHYKSHSGLLLTADGKDLVAVSPRLKSVTIPAGVTTIGGSAFKECSELTDVKMPAGVTRIGDNAFAWCWELRNVIIPEGVDRIGNGLFEQCANLESVTIPASVTSIGECAFDYCDALTSVTISANVTSIGKGAFTASGLKTVYVAAGDGGRIKKLFLESGHKIDGIEFVEREVDGQ